MSADGSNDCLSCGHPFDPPEFCSVCKHEFCCGSLASYCDREGCAERRLCLGVEDARYRDEVTFEDARSEGRIAEPRQRA